MRAGRLHQARAEPADGHRRDIRRIWVHEVSRSVFAQEVPSVRRQHRVAGSAGRGHRPGARGRSRRRPGHGGIRRFPARGAEPGHGAPGHAGRGRLPADHQPGPGQPVHRGPGHGAGRRAAHRAGPRPPVRGRHLGGQPGVRRAAAGLPGGPAVLRRGARGRPGRPGHRRQGRAGRRVRPGRGQPDQLPADQPGRAQAGVRDRGRQPGRGQPELPRRHAAQQRAAPPGGHQPVPAGPQPGGHPGPGGLPQRADGAHPVRPADPADPRHPDAGQPAVDQQVLHHGPGPGPQLHRVGRAARAHRVRHLLPQPRRADARGHPG